jgi:hypothetical protein
MKTQTREAPREPTRGLGELSVDLMFEIHQLVDSGKRANEIQIGEKRIIGKEGDNTLVRLGYSSYDTMSFQNGAYECTVILDGKNKLVEVRDVRDRGY